MHRFTPKPPLFLASHCSSLNCLKNLVFLEKFYKQHCIDLVAVDTAQSSSHRPEKESICVLILARVTVTDPSSLLVPGGLNLPLPGVGYLES